MPKALNATFVAKKVFGERALLPVKPAGVLAPHLPVPTTTTSGHRLEIVASPHRRLPTHRHSRRPEDLVASGVTFTGEA